MEDIKLEVDDVFGTLNSIKIISDVDKFKGWLKKEHRVNKFDDIFDGYKFFIESAIRTFLYTMTDDLSFKIKEDYTFFRSRHVGIYLNKIPNTCEKTVLIKNINKRLRLLKKAKNFEEIKHALGEFRKDILKPFNKIFEDNVAVSPDLNISKEKSLKYVTMFYTYIFLNDTSRYLPKGYWLPTLLDSRVDQEKHKKSFKGYKYSLQFVWFSLLGKRYHSSIVKNLHKAKKWTMEEDFIIDLDTEPKVPKRRDDLHHYFLKIGDKIIRPIERKHKINFGFKKILYIKKKVTKDTFKNLLQPVKDPQLSEKERLDHLLFWYNLEFLDSSKSYIFSGIPTFISLLIGVVELKRKYGLKDKTYVCKFRHPDKSVKGNDYSYGILVQSFGSFGSDFSGWILFYDCCGDYSGFSGQEHAQAEMFIKQYKKLGLIKVREMEINKKKLKEYIADKIIERKRKTVFEELDKETERRFKIDFLSESRGLVLELITYYVLSKKNYDFVDWNIKINQEQLDIILETNEDFILVECKCNPNNMNLEDEMKRLKRKLFNYDTNKNKICEFWFWERPSQETVEKLNESGIEHEVFSELIRRDPLWTNKKLDKLKFIFERSIGR